MTGPTQPSVLSQMEGEVQRRLQHDQDDDRGDRRARQRGEDRPEDDRHVQHDQAAVRREHLADRRDPLVLATAEEVEVVRQAVADQQSHDRERDRPGVRSRADIPTVRTEAREQRQREHEHAMDDPEDAVMHDEERDEPGPRHTGCRPAVDRPAGRHAVVIALGAQHLEDVERADDAVLKPVDDQDRPDAPAEEQHADERDGVGCDEGDDRPDRRRDRVPGEQALHPRDATARTPRDSPASRGGLATIYASPGVRPAASPTVTVRSSAPRTSFTS